jgi:hypothetical protein
VIFSRAPNQPRIVRDLVPVRPLNARENLAFPPFKSCCAIRVALSNLRSEISLGAIEGASIMATLVC